MHLLLGTVLVILAWGIGMIVRPAATLFLTVLVGGFIYLAVYSSSLPPQHQYSEWKDARGIVHYH